MKRLMLLTIVLGLFFASNAIAQEPGDTLWTRTYGGTGSEQGFSVQQTQDGGYIITGYAMINWNYDVYLIKTDASGNALWTQTYGGSSNDYGYSVQQTSDGGYIIAGYTSSYGAGYYDIYLIKTDGSGNQVWSQTLGGISSDYGKSIQETSDGGYIITGFTESYGAGFNDVYLIRLGTEGSYPDVTITLTPYGFPIQIPATGGNFDFNVMVSNYETTPVIFNAWTDITLPDSSIYGPVIGPLELTLLGGGSIDRDQTQVVPANAPAGMYSYNAYVGDNMGNVWNEDHFVFEKLTVGDGLVIREWWSLGESFEESVGFPKGGLRSGESDLPLEFALLGTYPNPFNPTTAISYQLSAVSFVNLSVYDVSGRKVAELENGWRDAGVHEVIWDASDLASGVYIYRLEAVPLSGSEATPTMMSGKMVLMK